MKINRHDQAKILSAQESAWLFDGKLGLVSDLKLFRLLIGLGNGRGMEAIASLSLLSYIEGLPSQRDRALFGICLYTTARVNEACSLHTADVYGTDGRVRDRITFRRATTKGKQETRSVPVSPELRKLLRRVSERSGTDQLRCASLPLSRTLGARTYLPGVCRCHFTGSL